MRTLLFLCLLFFVPVQTGQAQDALSGVVWQKPSSALVTKLDLEAMRRIGVQAVRTGPITDQSILQIADSLGIILFREIPLYDLAGESLTDSTRFGRSTLKQLIRAGTGHQSAGPIGLAVRPDVSTASSCAYFDSVRRGVDVQDGQKFYYVSPFIEDDKCSESVDFVLLHALDRSDPVALIDRWKMVHTTSVGIGSIGWWVEDSLPPGFDILHTPQWQARRLERALGSLVNAGDLQALFVHRWRDFPRSWNREQPADADIYFRSYGLQDITGHARPALAVLSGFYTGKQTVFALPVSVQRPELFPWYIILGWMLIVVVATLYASSPRFRFMVPRYFFAHGFFRNAVREAREVLPIVSTAMLSVVGLSIGMIGSLVIEHMSNTAPGIHLARILSANGHTLLSTLLSNPVLLTVLLGGTALLSMAVWMGIWMMVASKRAPLLPSQALMLAIWPRWQLLLLLPASMSISTLDPARATPWIVLIVLLWMGSALWSSMRTAYDMQKITRCGTGSAVFVWFFNPVVLVLAALLAIGTLHSDQVRYLLHLGFRQ